VLQRNLRFLGDFLALETSPVNDQTTAAILKLVKEQPGLHLDALVGQLTNAGVDNIYGLIASNRIYVDLHAAPLAEPERVRVFRDADIARAYELVGMQEPAKGCLRGEARGRLARASPAELRVANRRYAILAPYLAGLPVGHSVTPARTIRDWLARWRAAERVDGCGFAGLLPRLSESGNRLRKLPESTLALIDEFLAADFETLKQKRKFAVYAALVRACEDRGVAAPSYKTFAQAAVEDLELRPAQDRPVTGLLGSGPRTCGTLSHNAHIFDAAIVVVPVDRLASDVRRSSSRSSLAGLPYNIARPRDHWHQDVPSE
jgi:putative transposase